MWRSVRSNLYYECYRHKQSQRRLQKSFRHFYSTQSPSSTGAVGSKILIGVAGATVLVGGGTILAAKLHPKFRAIVQDNVPYSSQVFTLILGEIEEPAKLEHVKKTSTQEFPFRSQRLSTETPSLNKRTLPVVPASPTDASSMIKDDASKPNLGKVEGTEMKDVTVSKTISDPTSSGGDHSVKKDESKTDEKVDQAKSDETSSKVDQKVPLTQQLKSQIDSEIKRQEQDIDQFYKEKSAYAQEYKEELLKQLRRQAVFHSEYLRALLQAQRKELKAEFEDTYQDKIVESKLQAQQGVAIALGQLTAIKDELKNYVETHEKWSKAKKLWVACLALKRNSNPVRQEGVSYEAQRKPLTEEVELLSAAGADDEFVSTVIRAIPEEAVKSGVYGKDILIERFLKLDRVCRRVASVGECGGNLFKYATSYFMSMFIVSRHPINTSLENDEPVEVSKLDTFHILDRAKIYILQGNIETALRYINLLKGTPRYVAKDWLKDARIFLEVNQVADLLITRCGADEVD
ncbi:hypothetical protein CHUAL_008757 [Chamberlinius hualienensis]